MHLDHLKDILGPEGYILALGGVANWCNGNLMGITRSRMAEQRKREQIALLSQNGDATKELPTNLTDPERHLDNGLPKIVDPIVRGSYFASLRKECFIRAEELNLTNEFDIPRNFKNYITSRLARLKESGISEAEIHNHMVKNLGVTEVQAREMAVSGLRQQILQLENEMDDLIAHDSDYDDNVDPEEAEQQLGCSGQHRMRVKLVDAFLYRAQQMLKPIGRYQGDFSDQLADKRRDYLYDAVKMDDELKVFETANKKQISKELDDRSDITTLNRENAATLHRVREQMFRDKEIAIAAAIRRQEINEALKKQRA